MSEKCSQLNIPSYLYTNGRTADQNFNSEKIWRRFKGSSSKDEWRKTHISAAIFPVRDDSCIRSKYSRDAEDVLYNDREQDNGLHYRDWGILEIETTTLFDFLPHKIEQNGIVRSFTIDLFHSPTECIYPHSEIKVLENGNLINASKPKSTKTAIRDFLLKISRVIKNPN
jgi:hypothetical protein